MYGFTEGRRLYSSPQLRDSYVYLKVWSCRLSNIEPAVPPAMTAHCVPVGGAAGEVGEVASNSNFTHRLGTLLFVESLFRNMN